MLVIGEAPSRWMEENGVTIPLPLARRELAALAGIIPPRFDELFECVNVLDRWPGKQGKGDAFPLALARLAAARLLPSLRDRSVVLLGRRVEDAFFPNDHEWFEWCNDLGCRIAVCPHPSHVSRWWNDATNRRRAATFWGSLVALEVK